MKKKKISFDETLEIIAKKLSRRDFLALSSATGAFLSACQLTRGQSRALLDPSVGKRFRVAVLGGGVSGLATAYQLEKRGFQVTVLELTDRVSGRLWTNTDFFEDGQYCEYGATRLPDCHDLTLRYVKDLGLELETASYGDQDDHLYFLDGIRRHRKTRKDEIPWPEERARVEGGYQGRAFTALKNPKSSGWPLGSMSIQDIKDIDGRTFRQYLQSVGYSDFALKLVRSSNGGDIDTISALYWLGGEYLEKDWQTTYRVRGGNQQIGDTLASKLSKPVEMLARVRSVQDDANGTKKVTYIQRGDEKSLLVDFVVCALPLNVIQKVTWNPGLSSEKMIASQSVPMQACTRINLQFKERFWNKDPYNLKGLKILHSDLTMQRLWDMTASEDQKHRTKMPSSKGILTSYIQGEDAIKIGRLDPKDRVQHVLENVATVFDKSGVKKMFIKGDSFLWHKQSWIGGGWANYAPNQIQLFLAMQKPEKGIYFVGDHASLETGWIQGALGTAERAVDQVSVDAEKRARIKS